MNEKNITQQTGTLFGDLWKPFDDESYEHSIGLFRKRFEANGFDLDWFKGKRCLDVGCGGGRYSIAMAREGASEVVGVDVGEAGLMDAGKRAADYPDVSFRYGSVLDLPFDDEEFDFVLCSGILMHTPDPEKGFKEVCRVVKPGGKLYLLLYATGGVRWPAVMDYRACMENVSVEELKSVMESVDFPPNKVRTLADDLKVPLTDVYTWEYVLRQLNHNGMGNVERWTAGRLDHEENLDEMIFDMEWFHKLFNAGALSGSKKSEFGKALEVCEEYLSGMRLLRDQAAGGAISQSAAERIIIGQGHHRLIADKVK